MLIVDPERGGFERSHVGGFISNANRALFEIGRTDRAETGMPGA